MPNTRSTRGNVPSVSSPKSVDNETLSRQKHHKLFRLADQASSLLLQKDSDRLVESYKLNSSVDELTIIMEGLINAIRETQYSSRAEYDVSARENAMLAKKLAIANTLPKEWQKLYEEIYVEKETLHKEVWTFKSEMKNTESRLKSEIHDLKTELQRASQEGIKQIRGEATRRRITVAGKSNSKNTTTT